MENDEVTLTADEAARVYWAAAFGAPTEPRDPVLDAAIAAGRHFAIAHHRENLANAAAARAQQEATRA